MDGEQFGSLLRRLRTMADLTLEQLAEAAGVSDRAISDMERGISRRPRVSTVEALADALGVDDAGRDALVAAARAGRGAGTTTSRDVLPLPRAVADFTGRDAELAWIHDRAAAAKATAPSPVLLLSGLPGIGKTSLAVRAAAELAGLFPDGRHFLDLEGLAGEPLSATTVLTRLIQAVAPDIGRFSRRLADATALWHRLAGGRRMLMVLDNAAGEDQIRAALPPQGPAVVVVTSRRILSGLGDAERLRLAALPEREAVRLLSAITVDRPTTPEDLRHLARLCANVPLAIRVAGNRLASRPRWSAGDLIARLAVQERRLDALVAGDLQVNATFALSYEQLPQPARQLFRRLSLIFGTSAGEQVAAILLGDAADAADTLDALVELGLLQGYGAGRARFHDLLRLYAQQRLRQEESAEQIEAVRTRLRDWLLGTAIAAGSRYEPEGGAAAPEPRLAALDSPEAARTWLMDESENWFGALTAAATAGEHQLVVDVAESLHWFSDYWLHWGRWHEVFALAAEAARRLGDDVVLATQLGYLSWAHTFCLGEYDTGLRHAEEAFRCAERASDPLQMAWARMYRWWALRGQLRHEEALLPARQAAEYFAAAGDRAALPQALLALGDSLFEIGRHHEALEAINRAIALVTDPATAPRLTIARQTEVSARSYAARAHYQLQEWNAVVETVSVALRRDGQPAPMQTRIRCLQYRAKAYRELGDVASCRADLEALLRLQVSSRDDAGATETERALRNLQDPARH
ncbi:helix-turn-helix domain-containing protein [Actinoplanes sp. NPDC023936]|uniref:helix-turn-helix domain-containing protein n=1 Tax=Actinoplanes sp. NPDC023936 TaxID=3154910 RepID=UPI003402085C